MALHRVSTDSTKKFQRICTRSLEVNILAPEYLKSFLPRLVPIAFSFFFIKATSFLSGKMARETTFLVVGDSTVTVKGTDLKVTLYSFGFILDTITGTTSPTLSLFYH